MFLFKKKELKMFSRVGPFTNMPGDVLPEYSKDHRVTMNEVQFGFHPVGGRNAHFSRDLLVAGCCNHGGHCVCYGAWPFRGHSEMEVKIIGVPYNDSISSHERELLMGLMKRPKGSGHVESQNDVPRCSQDDRNGDHFIVYQGYEIFDHTDPKDVKKQKYGYRTSLRIMDKHETLGIQVTENGSLYFYINGVCQGLAASNVYRVWEGYDIYPFFELRGNVHIVRITKALVAQEEVTLQQLCVRNISNCLPSAQDAVKLPLPEKFQVEVKNNHDQVYTPYIPERYQKIWTYIFEEKKYKKSTSSRFTDFFKFCMMDKRRKEDPHLFERMRRRAQEEREGGRGRDDRDARRRRDRHHFYDEFMFDDFPWNDKNFW